MGIIKYKQTEADIQELTAVSAKTGLPIFTNFVGGGFRRGTVNIIGARMGVGKSRLAMFEEQGRRYLAERRATMLPEDYEREYGTMTLLAACKKSVDESLVDISKIEIVRQEDSGFVPFREIEGDVIQLAKHDKPTPDWKLTLSGKYAFGMSHSFATKFLSSEPQTHKCVCTHSFLLEGCKCKGI